MLSIVENKTDILNICGFNLNDIFNGVLIVKVKQLNCLGIKVHILKDNWYSHFLSLPKCSTVFFGDPFNAPAGFITSSEESIHIAKELVMLIASKGGNVIPLNNGYYILGRSKLHKTEIILALYLLDMLNADNIYDDKVFIGNIKIIEY